MTCKFCGEPDGLHDERFHGEPMLQWFRHEHLPEMLQPISRTFCCIAKTIVAELPSNPERTVALRKLLEAKDAAVRAAIYEPAPIGRKA